VLLGEPPALCICSVVSRQRFACAPWSAASGLHMLRRESPALCICSVVSRHRFACAPLSGASALHVPHCQPPVLCMCSVVSRQCYACAPCRYVFSITFGRGRIFFVLYFQSTFCLDVTLSLTAAVTCTTIFWNVASYYAVESQRRLGGTDHVGFSTFPRTVDKRIVSES
jgi:hypothetical protein